MSYIFFSPIWVIAQWLWCKQIVRNLGLCCIGICLNASTLKLCTWPIVMTLFLLALFHFILLLYIVCVTWPDMEHLCPWFKDLDIPLTILKVTGGWEFQSDLNIDDLAFDAMFSVCSSLYYLSILVRCNDEMVWLGIPGPHATHFNDIPPCIVVGGGGGGVFFLFFV